LLLLLKSVIITERIDLVDVFMSHKGGSSLAIQVNIDNNKISNLSADAQATLKTQVSKYADDIIKESNLLEEGMREDGANAEITSSIVMLAVHKNKIFRKRKRKNLLIAKIVSVFSILFTGFLFDSTGYQDDALGLILFIIVLMIACISTVLQFVLEERE